MNEMNRLDLMIEAMAEIIQEDSQRKAATPPPPSPPEPAFPTLRTVLADLSPLPREALFLGVASDGLPVLLNLYDSVPGPILITGDSNSGKTKLLQTIARAAELLHSPDIVQFGVVTETPEEWKAFIGKESNAGLYLAGDDTTKELLQALVTWAHQNRGDGQFVLLLIDNLDAITHLDEQTQQNLRWLLLRGPSRRIWPFITLNTKNAMEHKEWLEFFRTRLFGFTENPEEAYLLTGHSTLDHLQAGTEFAMRESGKLLRFWLPSIYK